MYNIKISCYSALLILIGTIITLIIITLIIRYTNKYRNKKMLKGAYLNTASTDASHTGEFNPSDLAYPQVLYNRSEFENLIVKIKNIVRAPINSFVIFNSGATESIATVVNWARNINADGVVVGSEYDHSAVEDACKEYKLGYTQTLRSGKLDDKTVMIYITHVDSKTGEIVNIENFKRNIESRYKYLSDGTGGNTADQYTLQYKPLLCVDVTQSIGKIPIDMRKWEADAIFFSLHKIGGPIGVGVMVMSPQRYQFHPLIPGKQQHGLRGGTYPLESILSAEHIIDKINNPDVLPITRKDRWEEVYDELVKNDIKVHKPRGNHLYNTYLIDLGHCPMGVINTLAQKGIYVGNSSACRNEISASYIDKPQDEKIGSLRISFTSPEDIPDDVVKTIINVIKEDQANPGAVKVISPDKSFEEAGKHKKKK